MEPPFLGHYLTFIHYFGFSIKPVAAVGERGASGSGVDKLASLLRVCFKFNAVGLTAFLALNHLLVLLDYLLKGDKVLTELMLEARLVITKFSALIFVLLWHFKQSQVRQLIALVGSANRQLAGHLGPSQRVLRCWIMCLAITGLHFGLSEAEVTSAQHLWQWLDDYSLHRLNNRTTSLASLMLMASLDNYIYTVHVYGTRLIGASVICLVCALQSDHIRSLTRHARALTRPLGLAEHRVPWAPARPAPSQFVLGESSWLGAEEARRRLPAPGHLSGRLSLALWSRAVGSAPQESPPPPPPTTTPTANLLRLAWEPPAVAFGRPKSKLGRRPNMSPLAGGSLAPTSGSLLEVQLERLAASYELIRRLNERIDACFGPTLLIQYSALFLMSCIDVVYFSICLNPNTKTKYIIISGMVLLWWPYLLLYKYASDIGSRSKELLVSVRRLARLALLERLQLQSSPGHHLLSLAAGLSSLREPGKRRAPANLIVNKLDHVFKATHLSIMGTLVVDKFFLLNFAKIVITASVMIIQFIS